MMKVICALDGDKMKPRPVYKPRQGGNGLGVNYGDVAYTQTAADRHMVAVCARTICVDMGGGKSSARTTTEKSPTLDCAHGGAPAMTRVRIIRKSSDTPLTSPADDATMCADPKRRNLAGKTKVRVVLYHPSHQKEKRK